MHASFVDRTRWGLILVLPCCAAALPRAAHAQASPPAPSRQHQADAADPDTGPEIRIVGPEAAGEKDRVTLAVKPTGDWSLAGATYRWQVGEASQGELTVEAGGGANDDSITFRGPGGKHVVRVKVAVRGTFCEASHRVKLIRVRLLGVDDDEWVDVGVPVPLQGLVEPEHPGGMYVWSTNNGRIAQSLSGRLATWAATSPKAEANVSLNYALPPQDNQ